MLPIIGVMPLFDEKRNSLLMLPGYYDGITEAGGIPVMLPLSEDSRVLKQVIEQCQGLLFTGGQDVSPELYGEDPLNDTVVCCIQRDRMERIVLQEAMKLNKPILGICRGIQFIDAALGGTLYQDLPTEHPSSTEHHQKPPYDEPAHHVDIIHGTPLYELTGADRLAVNSYHHQAIKTLAPTLKEMALSEDGLIEAVFMPEYRFLWAVQWHPEFSHKTDKMSKAIFNKLIEEANCDVEQCRQEK